MAIDKPVLYVVGVNTVAILMSGAGLVLTAYLSTAINLSSVEDVPTGLVDAARFGPLVLIGLITGLMFIGSITRSPVILLLSSLASIVGTAAAFYFMLIGLNLAGILPPLAILVSPIEIPANCTIEEIKATDELCGYPGLMCVGASLLIMAQAVAIIVCWRARGVAKNGGAEWEDDYTF